MESGKDFKIKIKAGISVLESVLEYDKALLKDSIAAEMISADGKETGRIMDLSYIPGPVDTTEYEYIRLIKTDDQRAVDMLNHSCSHVMASAIKQIYKDAKFAIGPSIKNGFYYDFDTEAQISDSDLKDIEKAMKKIVKTNLKFEKETISKKEARKLFKDNPYKIELIDDIPGENVSIYHTGEFIDLCSGPHIQSTGKIGAFKLTSVAGAYWRGNEENKMLVRVYGTSFFKKEDLKEHLERIEKAKRSDHRKIGKDLDLFSFHDEGPGFAFYHANGMKIRNLILEYWREEHEKAGYSEINTPIILSNELWKTSGHWDNYKDNMYFVKIDDNDFAVKPMNCPGAIIVYKSKQHSYKEFPIRVAELGLVHRHEKSGVLHGLFRVRSFTQDDAHLFCLEEQVEKEIEGIIDLIDRMYTVFGFDNYNLEISTRPEKRIGTDEMWDRAESVLTSVLDKRNMNYKINEGDGAFYGPKIDFHINDCLGRTWQCATIQLDFAMPEKFDIYYNGEDNEKHRPVMIHRVVLGSIDRFMGILIEHYSGNLPPWLAPVQAIVLPISDKFSSYGDEVHRIIKDNGFRVEIDKRVESLNKKIRQAEMKKIPYMIIIGNQEEETQSITIRKKTGEDLKQIKVNDFLSILREVTEKRRSFI